jgi:hypothetical protein
LRNAQPPSRAGPIAHYGDEQAGDAGVCTSPSVAPRWSARSNK